MEKLNHSNIIIKGTGLPKHAIEELKRLGSEKIKRTHSSLVMKNIDKVYDNGFQAVFGTSFEVSKGEFISLLGPSGCGKTTTLRMIAGLEDISSGQLFINNIDHTYSSPAARDLTMVFQNYALFPHMSVKKNLEFGLRGNKKKLGMGGKVFKEILFVQSEIKSLKIKIRNISKINKYIKNISLLNSKVEKTKGPNRNNLKTNSRFKIERVKMLNQISELESKLEDSRSSLAIKDKLIIHLKNLEIKLIKLNKKRVLEAKVDKYENIIKETVSNTANLLGLEYYLSRKPSALSGGQRQRVALGRSMVSKPSLFLMDEPLSNLDAKLRATMRKEIRQIHDKIGAITVYVTHDQIEAMTMSDKVIVMSDGFIQQIGSPKEIYEHPSNMFVASFVGTPSMNLMEGYLKKGFFISNKGLKIPLSKDKFMNTVDNQKVVLGIRPYDFTEEKIALPSPIFSLKLKIINRELLGNEVHFIAEEITKKEKFVFVTSSYNETKIGDITNVKPLLSRTHLFDLETTIALTSKFNLDTLKSLKNWVSASEEIDIRKEIMEKEKQKSQKKSLISKIVSFRKKKDK